MSDPTPVAVCSRSFSRSPELRAALLARYPNARFNEQGVALRGAALVAFLSGAHKAIVALEPLNEGLLAQLPELRVVAKFGVGLDGLDLGALQQRGVRLGWTGGVNRRAVAELVLLFAIDLLRGVSSAQEAVRRGGWRAPRGRELSSVTFGVLGCGHIGKEVVRLLAPFGPRVIAHDVRPFDEFYSEHGVQAVSFDELLAQSTVLSVHVPLDASTRMMLGASALDAMTEGALVINTARGGIVDEAAVAARVRTGALGGAAFDVFLDEPPADNPLVGLENVLVTPHMAGTSKQSLLQMGTAAIAGLDRHAPANSYA